MGIIVPTNFARGTVATPPSGTGGLTFSITAGQGVNFPSPGANEYFYGVFTNAARSAYEVVKVEARSTDSFTIATGGRGQDSTAAATWNTGDIFFLPTTRKMYQETSFSAASLALAGLTPLADRFPYFTSGTAASLATITSYGRTLLAATDAAAAGVVSSANPNYTTQTLVDGATINWNLDNGCIATITLGGNRTMAAPTNMKNGTYILYVLQDGTGSRTITWNPVYKWSFGVAPTLSTGAGKLDIISFVSDGTTMSGSYMLDVR